MFEKDDVWVNVSGIFTRGNLDGKLFILFYFILFLSSDSDPHGDGERMVTDFQDLTLAVQLALSDVFSAHLHKFSPSILRRLKRTMPVTMTKVADPRITTEKMTLMTLKMERKKKMSLQMGGTPVVPIHSKSSFTSTKERMDIKYVESDSDLCDDEERNAR